MTEEEALRISRFIKKRYGIDLSRKKEIMQGRLENYIRGLGFANYTDYMNAVETDITGSMEREMVNILTTNHTYFMREFEHFDFMRTVVLPKLRKKEAKTKDIRIWCGAASTGQEPYMLAMLLTEFFGLEHEYWDTTVLATDVATDALRCAIAGKYHREQIEMLPDTWKRRFLRQVSGGEEYEITKEIKDEVLFRQFNLMDIFPFKRKMHVIFLRNVMIYFDKETKRELIRKVCDALEPGGYLFVGRTETIDREGTCFEQIQPSIFRKKKGSNS